MITAIQKLMEQETAGDPVTGLKWTRKTTAKIARQLRRLGIRVGRNTVGRLLRLMKYSLRTNRKKITTSSSADRDSSATSAGSDVALKSAVIRW